VLSKKKKKDWLIVCHMWFVHDIGFVSEIFMDATQEEAEEEAILFAHRHETPFRKAKAKAFELPGDLNKTREGASAALTHF